MLKQLLIFNNEERELVLNSNLEHVIIDDIIIINIDSHRLLYLINVSLRGSYITCGLHYELPDDKGVQETKELPVEEHEAAKKIDEQVSAIQEILVIDNDLVNKLTAENEKLKAMVSSLEQEVNETERKYEETSKIGEERLKQTMEAESKIIQVKIEMQRLEEKMSDMGTGKQKFQSTPIRTMSEPLENGHFAQLGYGASKQFGREDSKMKRSTIEKQQQESVDDLIKCVAQNIGFSQEKPIAAFTIYKCRLYWKSFEAEKTSVFVRLIEMIGYALEGEDNTDTIAYWLTNTSSLLFLLQRTLKAIGAWKPPAAASLFARMTKSFRSSSVHNYALVA
ncbi:hypothetical protein V6N12_061838 [Hibiscus sabdariffa]|uniref:Dilute domain-containing protein n=1 Tax=Hibiscus sabdariffa TaxID=183260 RepID=A0ABR2DY87_9ROSI